jgi:hypothetical protein
MRKLLQKIRRGLKRSLLHNVLLMTPRMLKKKLLLLLLCPAQSQHLKLRVEISFVPHVAGRSRSHVSRLLLKMVVVLVHVRRVG